MPAGVRMRIAWDRLSGDGRSLFESNDLAMRRAIPIHSESLSSVADIVGSGEDLDQAEELRGRLRSS